MGNAAFGVIGATIADNIENKDIWVPKKDEQILDFANNLVFIGDGVTLFNNLEPKARIF